jgi:4-amino-4-deoxy-L-arabinose transferase-like glycosyltransferase
MPRVLRRAGIGRGELALLAGIALAGWLIRLAFVIATNGHQLQGDELEYHSEGQFIEQGHWFWTLAPTGEPHEGMWKTPVYPTFVGLLYKLLGPDYDRVLLVQTLIGPVTIVLAWVLARRLFGSRVALLSAAVVAVAPFAWQFEVRLLAEALVAPLTLLFLIVLLDREMTVRRAAAVGLVAGLIVLTRPSAIYLIPVFAVAFVVVAGIRRGAGLTAVAVAATVLVIAPWTIRNYEVSGAFVPLSIQDAAPYGTFNDDSANDPVHPWAWRIENRRDAPILRSAREIGDVEFRNRLRRNTIEYIKDHPSSVAEAFFWNGITRFWDLRRPQRVVDEARFNGRTRTLTAIGLAVYWVLLPLAVAGLWLARRRRAVALPLLALALSASVVFTAEGATRYRAPFEPIIAIVACSAAVPALARVRRGFERRRAEPATEPAV